MGNTKAEVAEADCDETESKFKNKMSELEYTLEIHHGLI